VRQRENPPPLLAICDPHPQETVGALGQQPQAARLEGRRFLIVTAPFGSFGRVLATELRNQGAHVDRMLFNAGDQLYWRGPAIRFKQPLTAWEPRLLAMASDYSDIVVFGEGGGYNQAVLRNTARMNARVWVLENGYFRPNWVTLERNGVNASSLLPRQASAYGAPAPSTPLMRPVGRILPHHVANISWHHLIQLPGRLLYPKYVAPFTQPPWLQCAGHIRRYIGLAFQPRSRCDAATIAARGPFFLACLQREGDAQLLRYSRFADNTAFLAEVMSSFAANAPQDARLVVKNHPLDPGLLDLGQVTRILAGEHGLTDRVDFIDGGNLAQLCRASRGMVVNNSSAALSALGFHTPVKVLGEAFFNFEGLTDQQDLSDFWRTPQGPDEALFTRFRAHVIARSQINGNFHEPKAKVPTAQALVEVFAGRRGDL